jgi:hypothetical protein
MKFERMSRLKKIALYKPSFSQFENDFTDIITLYLKGVVLDLLYLRTTRSIIKDNSLFNRSYNE